MLSNDLLSYSIMQNGEKAVAHTLPHYASLTGSKLQPVSLPPITSYVGLTEKNLQSLNSYTHKQSFASSAPPSLTSSSSASESPLASPRLSNLILNDSQNNFRVQNTPCSPNSHTHSALGMTPSPQRKRRQRLGPSCDNCRSRKVKCNAEVVMISRHFTGENDSNSPNVDDDLEDFTSLTPVQKQHVFEGKAVHLDSNYVLVLSNYKLIKYKPCVSCDNKGFACCFSKGFTKEDIVQSKRSLNSEDVVVSKTESKPLFTSKVHKKPLSEDKAGCGGLGKFNTRKSSCVACRKRKVKCVMTSPNGKCIGCDKKDNVCIF